MEIVIDNEFRSLIPPLRPEEYAALEQSLLSDGCRDSLVLWNKNLVDGHNRHEICQKHNIPFSVANKDFADREEVKAWIITNQFARRNLTAFQRAELALKLKPLYAARGKANMSQGCQNSDNLDTKKELAKAAGVSHDSLHRVEMLIVQAPEELKEKLAKGEVSINAAYNKIKSEVRRQKVRETIEDMPLPEQKYRVVYADPPWQYGNKGLDDYGHAERHYPTMSVEELCALPVKDMAAQDAVLFLWVTSPFLCECFKVISSWGFTYKTSIVWDKVKHNFGYYCSVRHELLLIATRGSCLPDTKELTDSVVSIERSEHSEKPAYFRDLIVRLYTTGRRVELFSRAKVDGFDGWGNQLKEKGE